ncbi:MAG: polyprenyl synthetase family protein [Kofleriaceae bacterium]
MSQLAPNPAPPSRLAAALARTWAAFDPGDGVPATLWQAALCEPLSEFARRPAKELRTMLCELGWALGGGAGAVPEAVVLTIDALHTGSLIVDDVEDQATERRGAPALHVLHGEPVAINAGTWLYFWALEQLPALGGAAEAQLVMHRRTIAALRGCHQGQALDLRARVDQLDAGKLGAVCAAITRGKTATLVGLAMELAALAAGAAAARAERVGQLGVGVGTALQQLDDLGSLGKARRAKGHEDLRGHRVTWPWAWLPEVVDPLAVARFQQRARRLTEAAADLDGLADDLYEAVAGHGRRRIRLDAEQVLAQAHLDLGDHPALTALAALLARMEDSYGC